MENFVFKDKDYYKREIIEMVSEMQNPEILKLLYGFALSGYKEEKAGRI